MFYDYKVIPAPRRLKRLKGVKSTSDLFAAMLSETINATARDGWEYLRSETLSAAEQGGWFRRATEVEETVLIFRRTREMLSPRISAPRPEPVADPATDAPRPVLADRPPVTPLRREPRLSGDAETAQPLRSTPRLGPADPV